jgi:hypothetical protein
MAKDIYVYEDQGWYSLVTLDGGYLLVYFLLGYDVTLGSCEGYSVGCLSVPDVFFLTKKLYKAPVPDGCVFCPIPASGLRPSCTPVESSTIHAFENIRVNIECSHR